jgi:hypothetical protein
MRAGKISCKVSVTADRFEPIWGSHSIRYEEFCLLRDNAVWFGESQSTFRRDISPQLSEEGKKETSMQQSTSFLRTIWRYKKEDRIIKNWNWLTTFHKTHKYQIPWNSAVFEFLPADTQTLNRRTHRHGELNRRTFRVFRYGKKWRVKRPFARPRCRRIGR